MTMTDIAEDTLLRRGTAHVETRVGAQTMMMSIEQGKYYAIEASAQRIWDLIETPRTFADLVDALVAEYDVPRAQCAEDTRAFITRLCDNGLIETGPLHGNGA